MEWERNKEDRVTLESATLTRCACVTLCAEKQPQVVLWTRIDTRRKRWVCSASDHHTLGGRPITIHCWNTQLQGFTVYQALLFQMFFSVCLLI